MSSNHLCGLENGKLINLLHVLRLDVFCRMTSSVVYTIMQCLHQLMFREVMKKKSINVVDGLLHCKSTTFRRSILPSASKEDQNLHLKRCETFRFHPTIFKGICLVSSTLRRRVLTSLWTHLFFLVLFTLRPLHTLFAPVGVLLRVNSWILYYPFAVSSGTAISKARN